jgi:MFS family permease
MALATLSIMNSAYSNILETIKWDLALNYTQSGALMSAYFLGYMLGQIPWGILADKFGSKPVISLSVLGVSISTITFGFSRGINMAIITRFIAGLLGAGIFIPVVRLVSSWFNHKERGTALGILNIGGSIGLITASWAAPYLNLTMGWRLTLKSIGIFGGFSAFIIWFLLKDNVSTSYGKIKISSIPFWDKGFWVLAFSQFIRLGSYYTFLAWLPLVMKEEFRFSILMTSTAMSLFNIAGILANPLGGATSDRVGERNVLLASFGLLGIIILVFSGNISMLIAYGSVFLIGWFINFVRSPAFTIIPRIFGTEVAGSISGIHNTFAALGALVIPFILGYVKDYSASYETGWIIVSGLAFLSSFILFSLKK